LQVAVRDFHVTGHSLGGGLATAASLDRGLEATVFNTATLHPNTVSNSLSVIKDAEKYIVSYSVDGDILSKLQEIHEPLYSGRGGAFPWDSGGSNGATNPLTSNDRLISKELSEPGQHILLDRPSKSWIIRNQAVIYTQPIAGFREPKSIVLHSISAVLESLKEKVLRQCKTLV
jgi:hypothetical protein